MPTRFDEELIDLRRNEPVVGPGGFPTTRFSRYLELSTERVLEATTTVIDNTESVDDLEFLEFWRS